MSVILWFVITINSFANIVCEHYYKGALSTIYTSLYKKPSLK